ncbi:hypothetical protein Pcinc_002044 [Petrolisthes cinctipes]|uniref:DM10 domain-containing protein n=1 Tax=Petrolisthes cinctipes TaxID=88211 RepID=A0AAE1L3Y0_PETCI|nr:hypothetical protein Pcinc_002044 [Petrolisthes cinctipes]
MSDLPLLPGFCLSHPQEKPRPLRQSLGWKKGVPLVREHDPPPLPLADEHDLERHERLLQFGVRRRLPSPPKFLPEWALLDKKVLRFRGYFSERVPETGQVCCVRPVVICYYLLDDAISVTEPRTPNSGLDQGRLLSRQRVPHPDGGFWHWTHLNLGTTLNLYGRRYVICDCDPFTKEYLLSEGTELGSSLPLPFDPYNLLRQSRAETPSRASDLRPHSAPAQPSAHRGHILKFDVLVEEGDEGAMAAVLLYRPETLTVELRLPAHLHLPEIKRFSPVLLRPVKVPLRDSGMGAFVDIGEEGKAGEWLLPHHLIPPATVTIFGRRVLVMGCDATTQRFLLQHHGAGNIPSMRVVDTSKPDESGSSGKTQSDVVPRERPRRGLLDSDDATVLRFSAKLDSPGDEDGDRCFILSYHVVDATMELKERPRPGGLGGRLLSRSQVPKPKAGRDGHKTRWGYDFYTLDDLCIGSTIDIWGRQYLITGADRHVYNYTRQHEDKVSPQLLSSLLNFFGGETEAGEVDK